MEKGKDICAVFDFYVGGHHLEYLHHLYEGAVARPDQIFYFILPSSFLDKKHLLLWPEVSNIRFDFFETTDLEIRKMSILKKSFFLSRILASYIRKYSIKEVFLIETIVYLPLLPFFLNRKVKVSSIIYHITYYTNKSKKKTVLLENFYLYLLTTFKCFERVFLLNAPHLIDYYNKKWNTTKFKFLPDPYVLLKEGSQTDIGQTQIPLGKKVFLHFGGLTRRKGTIDILDAIALLSEKELSSYCFVFAGRVIEDIKDEFYSKVNQLKENVTILIYDYFCEYPFLVELTKRADYILVPYKNVGQSSGVCSYAAQFNVPIIGPDEGLLGEIIKTNGLGVTVKQISPKSLAEAISFSRIENVKQDPLLAKRYLQSSTVQNFNKIIFKY